MAVAGRLRGQLGVMRCGIGMPSWALATAALASAALATTAL